MGKGKWESVDNIVTTILIALIIIAVIGFISRIAFFLLGVGKGIPAILITSYIVWKLMKYKYSKKSL